MAERYFIDYDDDEGGLIVEPIVTWTELQEEAHRAAYEDLERERLAATRHGIRRPAVRRHDDR